MNTEEIDEVDLSQMKDDEEIGYFHECGPEEVHDKYKDYPFAPERISVRSEMLSDKR